MPQHASNDVPPSPKSKHLPMPAKKKRKKKGNSGPTAGQAAAALARGSRYY